VARLRFTRWIPDDLVEALDWYDNKSPELGVRFRAAVDAAFDSIKQHQNRIASRFPTLASDFIDCDAFLIWFCIA
jgi:hypothetical protein